MRARVYPKPEGANNVRSMYVIYMEQCVMLISGRALRAPIFARYHEVTNTPGVQCVAPSGLFTCIIYTRNVGSHTLPHYDV